ncbi:MAG: peroxide stress protein YaaA [Pseudomonadota bacterium]|jgi:cytoplasmic iron level regulating protein YaaA (DUF328/UPF0246 family)
MLITLSPAKTLDFESPPPPWPHSTPDFLDHAALLIERLREFSPQELGSLMDLSDKLAALNVARNLAWHTPFDPDNARVALSAFNGDVYEGLDGASLSVEAVQFAQQHVRILSGLYGLLRPLDLMQPYRLEMGTRLGNPRGKDLYAFWGEIITEALNATLATQKNPVLVNLASEEYFKAVKPKKLIAPVITPVFEDWKDGRFKVISFFAKRARGLMTRFMIDERLDEVSALKDFNLEGYAFAPAESDEATWVFQRRLAA